MGTQVSRNMLRIRAKTLICLINAKQIWTFFLKFFASLKKQRPVQICIQHWKQQLLASFFGNLCSMHLPKERLCKIHAYSLQRYSWKAIMQTILDEGAFKQRAFFRSHWPFPSIAFISSLAAQMHFAMQNIIILSRKRKWDDQRFIYDVRYFDSYFRGCKAYMWQ